MAADLGVSPFSVAHALFEARTSGPEPSWLSKAGDDVLLARIRLGDRSGCAGDAAVEPLLGESYAPGQTVDIDSLQTRWDCGLAIALPQLSKSRRVDVLSCARESVLTALQQARRQGDLAVFQIGYVPNKQTLMLRVGSRRFDPERDAPMYTSASASEAAASIKGTDSIHEFTLLG